MNIRQGQSYESYFGPPSELVDVTSFLNSTDDLRKTSPPSVPEIAVAGWNALTDERRKEIEAECSVAEFQDQLHDVIRSPRLMGHTMQTHQVFIQSVQESADTSTKKKRKRATLPDPSEEHPNVRVLQNSLDSIQLQCWPLTLQAALFIRPPKNSDHNTLFETKSLSFVPGPEGPHQALLFVTAYSSLHWGHRLLTRTSQHVLLCSQSLGDLVDTIPCSSHEMPEEHEDEDGISRWRDSQLPESTGSVVCVEDVIYGDGQSEQDYSEKLLEYVKKLPAKNRPTLNKGCAMHDISFTTLQFCLNKPYWLLHAGDCEHFVIFEQLRLHHSSDPPLSSYPLTTQITPPLLDTCRACNKAPAVYAVCGDIRLGESPFIICSPCWRWMGNPQGENADHVSVVPLPKHELGWGG